MKSKKRVACLLVLFTMFVVLISMFLFEQYQYRNICKQFFQAIETKDVELMDEIFYEEAEFVNQNTTYDVIRTENMRLWDKIEYTASNSRIEDDLYFVEYGQGLARIFYYMDIDSEHSGDETTLMGSIQIERLGIGIYKITEIDVYDSMNTGFTQQLFGEVRK